MFKEILGDAFPIIEKFAPVIAGILGSPVSGAIANVALKAVAKKFGIDDLTSNDLPAAIANDPDAETKLSQLDELVSGFMKDHKIPIPSHIELNLTVKADFTKVSS